MAKGDGHGTSSTRATSISVPNSDWVYNFCFNWLDLDHIIMKTDLEVLLPLCLTVRGKIVPNNCTPDTSIKTWSAHNFDGGLAEVWSWKENKLEGFELDRLPSNFDFGKSFFKRIILFSPLSLSFWCTGTIVGQIRREIPAKNSNCVNLPNFLVFGACQKWLKNDSCCW